MPLAIIQFFKNIWKVPSRLGLVLSKPPPIKKLQLEIKHPAASKTAAVQGTGYCDLRQAYSVHEEASFQSSRIEVAMKSMQETRNMRIT